MLQVLLGIELSLQFSYPRPFAEFLKNVNFWDLSIPSIGCAITLNFHCQLLVYTLAPLGTLALLAWFSSVLHAADGVLQRNAPLPATLAPGDSGKPIADSPSVDLAAGMGFVLLRPVCAAAIAVLSHASPARAELLRASLARRTRRRLQGAERVLEARTRQLVEG